ncbi:hypothetical protein N7537_012086 [Penicillium hordei]|uniref:Uncharacterized protein n=1 Tax=Penicillium hordei TaxID=40994 RepID=A0AAD6GTD1_9EURO|nr:uncharacterized protein N7537_012086 [Penicillium hordei]KAJ5589408.1 hypothetical protein N7537_012086 [Penicillium hordei]
MVLRHCLTEEDEDSSGGQLHWSLTRLPLTHVMPSSATVNGKLCAGAWLSFVRGWPGGSALAARPGVSYIRV